MSMLGFEGLNAVGRIADIFDQLMTDSNIREKFTETGEISGRVRVEEYEIDFTLRRCDE